MGDFKPQKKYKAPSTVNYTNHNAGVVGISQATIFTNPLIHLLIRITYLINLQIYE